MVLRYRCSLFSLLCGWLLGLWLRGSFLCGSWCSCGSLSYWCFLEVINEADASHFGIVTAANRGALNAEVAAVATAKLWCEFVDQLVSGANRLQGRKDLAAVVKVALLCLGNQLFDVWYD